MSDDARDGARRRTLPVRALERCVLFACVAVVALFLLLPVAAIVARAFATPGLARVVLGPESMQALRLSLWTSALSVACIVVLGTPVAHLLARSRFRGREALNTLFDLPMVLPPGVAGLGLLLAFGRRGIVGEWLSKLGFEPAFTPWAVVMAGSFVALPLYVRAAKAGFDAIDPELELVAHTLGMSRARTFLVVSVPLMAPSMLAGAVLAWARALGEFGATIMFAGSLPGRTRTVPLAIYQGLETGLQAPLALSVLLVAVSFAVLIFARIIGGGRTFHA